MASIITATTTSGLTQSADNSGVLQLASGTGNLVTIPAVTGTAMVSGNMPAFSAYANTVQTVTLNTLTKVSFNIEDFDTNNNFDSTTNYRFTPTVEGYYQFNATLATTAATTVTTILITLYKNGSEYARGTHLLGSFTNNSNHRIVLSNVVYMNGSTDYVEIYGLINGTGTATFNAANSSSTTSRFTGSMVRGA